MKKEITAEGALDLKHSGIKSLEEIIHQYSPEELKRIKKLYLFGNYLENCNGIEKFLSLEDLELSRNRIQKIEKMEHLKNLKLLDIYDYPVMQISRQSFEFLKSRKIAEYLILDAEEGSIEIVE